MIDNLLNAMINPIFICAIGGLCALGTRVAQPVAQQPRGYPGMPYGGGGGGGGGGTQRPEGPAAKPPRMQNAVPTTMSRPRSTPAAR
jgi:hypothetical protein